ncbi:hypothetical protein Tco_0255259 [Tanacetum coccineum]
MILGSLKKFKKRSPKELKPRSKDTRRTSGNTTRNDPFPPFLLLEAQTQHDLRVFQSEDSLRGEPEQLLEQAPHSPEYVPEDHVPVYIPEPEHPEDLVPAEDEAPTPLLPPFFLSPRIRPLSPRALERPDKRKENKTPPQKRLLLTTPRPRCEVGESSAAGYAWETSRDPLIETRHRDTERGIMTALSCVNRRSLTREMFCTRRDPEFMHTHHDARRIMSAGELD